MLVLCIQAERYRTTVGSPKMLELNDLEGILIHSGKYKIGRKLGGGSFGVVFFAKAEVCGYADCAVKIEPKQCKHPQLAYESKVLKSLQLNEHGAPSKGIAKMSFTCQDNHYRYLGMEKLGCSLEDRFRERGCRFSDVTIAMIGIQMIERLQLLHAKGFLHRDIKPDNFMSSKDGNTVCIIDFGLCKRYLDSSNNHIPPKTGKSLTGTARYASIPAHAGHEQGRRDDMEAIGYVLLYFFRNGSLLWQRLKVEQKQERYDMIGKIKSKTNPKKLCQGLPFQMEQYITYTRQIEFSETPDYSRCKGYLQEIIENSECEPMFDWHIPSKKINVADALHENDMQTGTARFRCFPKKPRTAA